MSQFVKYPIQVLLQPQETKTFIEQSILIQTTLNFELCFKPMLEIFRNDKKYNDIHCKLIFNFVTWNTCIGLIIPNAINPPLFPICYVISFGYAQAH